MFNPNDINHHEKKTAPYGNKFYLDLANAGVNECSEYAYPDKGERTFKTQGKPVGKPSYGAHGGTHTSFYKEINSPRFGHGSGEFRLGKHGW